MVVSAIASIPEFTAFQIITINSEQTFELCALLTKRLFLHFHRIIIHYLLPLQSKPILLIIFITTQFDIGFY
ncbi:hypothetical protein EGC69_11720 [Escherichia coli]|jgi:hypothetical protein|nr:hypothetical protein [Escherichia coli]